MKAADVRRLLMLRAFEEAVPPPSAWSQADATWATREARLAKGQEEDARDAADDSAALLRCRAVLGCARLAERVPAVAAALRGVGIGAAPAAWALIALGFAFGLALDAVGASGRINILAPPFAALVGWNLAVYALLLVRSSWPSHRGADAGAGPLRHLLLERWARWRAHRVAASAHAGSDSGGGHSGPALARFFGDWARAGSALHLARVTLALHLAALAVAAGMLASLYLRGLAFEYRAGWSSTFLSAQGVHALLSVVFAPALALTQQPLPSADHLASLRLSAGGGENAARWIHLIALTVALVVLLPRALLAALAARRAGILSRALPVDLTSPYFQALRRALAGRAVHVAVVPYSYRIDEPAAQSLNALLQRALGAGGVQLTLVPALPLNAEDDLDHAWPTREADARADLVLPLFSAAATPERETHGAFLRTLRERLPGKGSELALIDESGLRMRYGAQDAAARLPERRAAWAALVRDAGREALFVDLAPASTDAAHDEQARRAIELALKAAGQEARA